MSHPPKKSNGSANGCRHHHPKSVCLWKKVFSDKKSTTTQDASKLQVIKCLTCGTVIHHKNPVTCPNFIALPAED